MIDGDTIEIHGQRIRLHGIDAPESDQSCDAAGEAYRCGQRAALALDELIAGRQVACERTDTDRYGRAVAICTAAGLDLGRRMVESGWALAYRKYAADYIEAENSARAAGTGIWAGAFIAPWDYRAGAGGELHPAASGGCVIKGNMSSSGERIYHVPGGQYYERTKIDESKGERWFCSEEEALAAGWRKSKR